MKKELFFDTETTGLVPKGAKWETDYMQFPHIVQLAWWNEYMGVESYIIKPDGWVIPDEVVKIHGITNERANKEGHDLDNLLTYFIRTAEKYDTIIGHNIHFDTSVVKANALMLINSGMWGRAAIEIFNKALDKSKRIDTMGKTIKFCGLKQKCGKKAKFPSLVELHTKLFGKGFDGAHDAGNDVMATKRCYDELVKREVI